MDIPSVSPEGEIPARNKKEWSTVIRDVDDGVRFEVSRLVAGIAHLCADSFYDTLLSNPEAAIYISSETVHERLHTALTNWLIFLFPENQPDVDALISLQERVGVAHARMRIPMTLVLQGIRTLKQTLRRRLFELDMSRDRLLAALSYMMTIVLKKPCCDCG
ncbi:protoglobin domain-containing protein [Acetobacter fallax]|uniref:Globin-sensor domain-containing protein n=1 Tax=Acetobacter fallax TaxID=1737473 RepID=A0ABX0KCQ1_9PROT|nr:protoglobin domain-containing protein [Acetobacter fallax]NHO32653.1 hypothetical protein [Acetobacter fallax]NHO36149.1 hypothetical protein [Acetobacter fallax]